MNIKMIAMLSQFDCTNFAFSIKLLTILLGYSSSKYIDLSRIKFIYIIFIITISSSRNAFTTPSDVNRMKSSLSAFISKQITSGVQDKNDFNLPFMLFS